MKISARINGRVTSINVRDSVCALHYMVCGEETEQLENHVLDTCHTIIDRWEGDTGKGLSSFITDNMLEEMLEENEVEKFRKLTNRLAGG